MFHFFFTDLIDAKPGDLIPLDETESHHLLNVLRIKSGTEIALVDGKGNLAIAQTTCPQKKKACARIITKQYDPPHLQEKSHICIAPAKSADRNEFLVEKLTEIGCASITFFYAQRSERRTIAPEKLTKRAIAALKQCKRLHLPYIQTLPNPQALITSVDKIATTTPLLKALAHTENGPSSPERTPLAQWMNQQPYHPLIIAIGPEGGFSPEEVKAFSDNNFKPISLGHSTLRVETAAIVAATLAANRLPGTTNS